MKVTSLLVTLLFTAFLLVSCSSGSNPVAPQDNSDQWTVVNLPVADSDTMLTENPYRGVFGAWKIHLDVETMTAEVLPSRNAKTIGDIFDADLSQFLTVSPCANCLGITALRLGKDGHVHMDVSIKHPFPNLTARPDLHGFDVRAIFIADFEYYETSALKITKPDGTEEDAVYYDYLVMNADGYTSHYDEITNDPHYFVDPIECTGNLNPYLRFFDDPAMGTFDPTSPSGYNVMPTGSPSDTKTAVIASWALYSPLDFFIVADVAYGHSATYLNRQDPQYYLPSFNRTEPWRMEYWIENNNLKYDDANSSCDLVIQVWDWQHNAEVDPLYPNPENKAGIRESSKVQQIEVFIPTLKPNPFIFDTPVSGDGTPSNPLEYRYTIRNVSLGYQNIHTGLVTIRDELYGAESPSGRFAVPDVPAGFPYSTMDIRDYAYYGIIKVNMPVTFSYGIDDYNNEIEVDYSSLYGYSSTRPEVEFFMDPGGGRLLYEWDLDYISPTFDVDSTGFECPYIDFTNPEKPGKRIAGLRVTINSIPPQQYLYEIPVYARGMEYEKTIPIYGPTNDAMSMRHSHAVHATEDKFYVAYTTKGSGGDWKIYVAAIDRYDSGTINAVQVSGNEAGIYYEPSLFVLEEGPYAGVYVAYVYRQTTYDRLRFNHGSLDLTFEPTLEVNVTNAGNSYRSKPCLIIKDGLYVIYHQYLELAPWLSRIHRLQSSDYGASWINDVELDTGSDSQYNPSAAYLEWGDYIYCVWEDDRNQVDFGMDLYMNRWDGSSSSTYNITSNRTDTDETQPSVDAYDETVGVAYRSVKPNGDTTIYLLTMRGGAIPGVTNYIQGMSGTLSVSNPSFAMCANNQYTVAYSQYDSSSTQVKSIARQYYESSTLGFIQYQTIQDVAVGTAPFAGRVSYVGVDCRRVANGNAIEHFVARKSYLEGIEMDTTLFSMYFGKIDTLCYITYGDKNDPY